MTRKLKQLLADSTARKTMTLGLLWLCLIGMALALRAVLLPFMLAALLAFVLNPAINAVCRIRFLKRSLPRSLAVFICYLILFGIIYLFAVFFVPQIYKEVARLAKETGEHINLLDENWAKNLISDFEEVLLSIGLPVNLGSRTVTEDSHLLISVDLEQIVRNMLQNFLEFTRSQSAQIAVQIRLVVSGLVNFIFEIILVLMVTGFILVDIARIKRFFYSMVPVKKLPSFEGFLTKLDLGLSGVVRGQLVICLVNAVLTLIGLLLIKVKYAFVLATIAGVFSLVPIFGSIISTIPIVLVGLTQSFSIGMFALAWIIGVHFLEANLLNPRILGHAAKIHPAVIVLSLVAGKHFYGLVGALLAVPIASILLTIFNTFLSGAIDLDYKRSDNIDR